MAKSGLESLLDALNASGADTSGIGGSASNTSSGSANTSGKSSPSENYHTGPVYGGKEASEAVNTFMDKVGNWPKRTVIIVAVILVLVLLGAYWWFHPSINIHSSSLWVFVSIFILLPLWIFLFSKYLKAKKEAGGATTGPAAKRAKQKKWISFIPVAILCVGLIGGLASLPVFPGNAKKYASILEIQELDYTEDIETVNYSEIPVIDHDAAEVLGDKALGEISDYVSQFEVDDTYAQINYNGTPYRVSGLNYADLAKWFFNRSEGIPAYVMVDMTTQEATIVRISDVDSTEGEGIKYSESEPLARNIERYVQLKYPFYMFEEFTFEVDDDGHPWWICPVQTRTIGLFGGEDISKVILCDAVTGECYEYEVEDVPSWVDNVYPADLLIEQYNWYGSYANGWINSWLGQSGVVQTTPASGYVDSGYNFIAKDDDVWVYTGVTSATSDASIVGFVLVNQRTAEAHFYSVAGATETVAMQSAEGQVQDLGYDSTFPILINVADRPTYFMALKDSSGLAKKFAMIDIQSYQRVAVGDTVLETQETYIEVLYRDGVITDDEASESIEIETYSASGTIASMTQVVVNGYSHFYVLLEGDDNIYDFTIPDLIAIVLYEPGEEISFTYSVTDSGYVAESIG